MRPEVRRVELLRTLAEFDPVLIMIVRVSQFSVASDRKNEQENDEENREDERQHRRQ